MYAKAYAAGFISPVHIFIFEILVLGSPCQWGGGGNFKAQLASY